MIAAAILHSVIRYVFLHVFPYCPSLGDSTQKQAILADTNIFFSPSDLSLFQQTYSLMEQECEVMSTGNTSDCTNNFCEEGNINTQYMMGVSENTSTIFWVEDTSSGDVFLEFVMDINEETSPPEVVTVPFSAFEHVSLLL
jgi:hypothetical protein